MDWESHVSASTTHVWQQVEQSIARQRPDRQSDQQLQDVTVVMGRDFGDGRDGQQSTHTDDHDRRRAIDPQGERRHRLTRRVVHVFPLIRVSVSLVSTAGVELSCDRGDQDEDEDGSRWTLHPV